MEFNNFVPRKYQDNKSLEIIDFDRLVQNNISIILGEPASGKTYQLKEFRNCHSENSHFVELVNILDEKNISQGIEFLLLDSIDEALTEVENPKKLQKRLSTFIKDSKEINPELKIVVTCRYLEWKEYFEQELKSIDENLKIYEVLPLSDEDINHILKKKDIDTEMFWHFVDDNYLRPLLKNIMIVFHIIDNFEEYKATSTTYIDIYKNVVDKYITTIGPDREATGTDKPLDEIVLIASSLATYMLLNRKHNISVNDLSIVTNHLYKINSKSITVDDLKIILNTALFEKSGNTLNFFHKSVQEYLVANFIAYKNLDQEILQSLFSNKIRFYEEFEEVIIYLTNLQPELFEQFVNFDPFIFNRHPELDKYQQEKLLISMLDKLQNHLSLVWGKWDYFKNTTIVKFSKIKNLSVLIQSNVDMSNINNVTFPYLIKLLAYNHSQDMEDLIFYILDGIKGDKSKCRNFIKNNFIDNFTFNSRLLVFMKQYDLLEKDTHSFFSFETYLFQSLYGVDFNWDSPSVNSRGYDFTNLLFLLDYIPDEQLKYIVPYINSDDSVIWYEYIKENYDDRKYNSEFMAWIIYGRLNNIATCPDKKVLLLDIVEFLRANRVYLHHTNKEKRELFFSSLAFEFWELYFLGNNGQELDRYEVQQILSFYDISLEDIKEASKKYPTEEYADKYVYFRVDEKINDFLMSNGIFKVHMEAIWEKQKIQEAQWKEKRENSEYFLEQHLQEERNEQNYIKSIEDLTSPNDIYNIIHYLMLQDADRCKEQLESDLGDKLSEFIELAKQEFIFDTSYLDLKKELTSSSLSNSPTFLFNCLFQILSLDEIRGLIKTDDDYEKLFWHVYRSFHQILTGYFIDLSKNNFKKLVSLIIMSIELSLEQSNNKKIGRYHEFKELFESLSILDKSSLSSLIQYISKLDLAIFASLEYQDRLFLLEILSLDETQYKFIKELMIFDRDNCSNYLKFLIQLNPNAALSDFKMTIYDMYSRYVKLHVKICRFFDGCKIQPEYLDSRYNKDIQLEKTRAFICLMSALRKKNIQLDLLDSQYIKMILIDYYEFFEEYKHPEGVYSPDIHDDMNDFINQVWNYLETTSEHIKILELLIREKNTRLSTYAGYTLEKSYNQQLKDRNYSNKYYKNIFDKDEIMKNVNTTNIHIDGNNNNAVVTSGKYSHVSIDQKLKNQKWWIVSLLIGIVGAGLTWWTLNSFLFGLGAGIIIFLVMIMFNPQRRFLRAALGALSLAVLQFSSLKMNIVIPENNFIFGFLKIGEHTIPWMGILLILLSGYLFYLDANVYKEKN